MRSSRQPAWTAGLSAQFAQPGTEKFTDVTWSESAVHGCHAVGGQPLVFHRGRYLGARPGAWLRRFAHRRDGGRS